MVSVYLKALIITIVLFVGNYFLVKYWDDSRAADLSAQVSKLEEDVQSMNALLLYTSVYNDSTAACPLLLSQVTTQQAHLYSLFGELQKSSQENVFTDTSTAKRSFVISNLQFWLYLQKLEATCGSTGIKSILYFYNDQGDCVECRAQAQVLNGIAQDCPQVRVFAVAYDSNLDVVKALDLKFGINSVPALVINGTVYKSLQPRETVASLVDCKVS